MCASAGEESGKLRMMTLSLLFVRSKLDVHAVFLYNCANTVSMCVYFIAFRRDVRLNTMCLNVYG